MNTQAMTYQSVAAASRSGAGNPACFGGLSGDGVVPADEMTLWHHASFASVQVQCKHDGVNRHSHPRAARHWRKVLSSGGVRTFLSSSLSTPVLPYHFRIDTELVSKLSANGCGYGCGCQYGCGNLPVMWLSIVVWLFGVAVWCGCGCLVSVRL